MKRPNAPIWSNLCVWVALGFTILNSHAQNVTGSLSAYRHSSYTSIASSFRIDELEVNGATFFGGIGNIFCSDVSATSLDEDSQNYPRDVSLVYGNLESMDIWGRYSSPQNESLAIAQVKWLIDNYFLSHFLEPGENAHEKQYAFQNLIWEIMGDGGTAAGLDYSTGNIDRSHLSRSRRYGTVLWATMNELLDNVKNSGVDDNYTAKSVIYAALDEREGYQDYVFLANDLVLVPEPSVATMGLLGSIMLLRRRR